MSASTRALLRNLAFWHWYPELLTNDLSPDQLRWQPEGHDTSILFAMWHTYRAADELVNGMVLQRQSVFAARGWAARLPVAETGVSRFGNGMTREQIGALDLDIAELCTYAKEVGGSISAGLEVMSEEEASAEIALPFFATVYPGYDRMSKAEAIAFFAIGHTAEHLGEVQMVKGMLGLKGAPL